MLPLGIYWRVHMGNRVSWWHLSQTLLNINSLHYYQYRVLLTRTKIHRSKAVQSQHRLNSRIAAVSG